MTMIVDPTDCRIQASHPPADSCPGRSFFHLLREQTTKASIGFTFLELIVVMAIMGTLSSVSVPAYYQYLEKARITKAIAEIGMLQRDIYSFEAIKERLPVDLSELNWGNLRDPWGNPYQYYDVTSSEGKGKARKDFLLQPINKDFDLYSMGKDGDSQSPLQAKASHDDVVRAWNGRYIGLAEEFNSGKDK